MNDNKNNGEVQNLLTHNATRVCNKCKRTFPVENFKKVRGKYGNEYYSKACKECSFKYESHRRYKNIKKERILDLTDKNISLLYPDEIFVKLMDYKDTWLSNYGRIIRFWRGIYKLMQGNHDSSGQLYHRLQKNVYSCGTWKYKRFNMYVSEMVVSEFIVNDDMINNTYIWHKGNNVCDYYFKNLYPLNEKQYNAVRQAYDESGNDSEEFIISVMNNEQYKADNWYEEDFMPKVCGVGYRGSGISRCNDTAYYRWRDMINRCYNKKFLKRQPQYNNCSVCDEWLNYSNFKIWYDAQKIDDKFDLDKDILFKGNKEYSPATVSFVPHFINVLFVNNKKARGKLPIGVHLDNMSGKYRAEMNFMGKTKKIGSFDTATEAFKKYKEYKETFIKNMAEQYKAQIPYKTYIAMLNWEVETTD